MAQVLRGIALADTVDLKRLSALYQDYRPVIFNNTNPSASKDYLFVVDLMLDVGSLCEDSLLLHQVVSDILSNANSQEPMPLTNKLFARIARLSLDEQFTDCVFGLYTLHEGAYRDMLKVFRMMERYMRNLKGTDERLKEMKMQVASLHYSSAIESENENECGESAQLGEEGIAIVKDDDDDEGMENKKKKEKKMKKIYLEEKEENDNDDDDFLEPSVLAILKDFDPLGKRAQSKQMTKPKQSSSSMSRKDGKREEWKGGRGRGGRQGKEGKGDAWKERREFKNEFKNEKVGREYRTRTPSFSRQSEEKDKEGKGRVEKRNDYSYSKPRSLERQGRRRSDHQSRREEGKKGERMDKLKRWD